MTLQLSDLDRALLGGDRGPAAALAMRIILRMAEVFGAGSLLNITQAHIDSTIYIGEANLEFAERLAQGGARVAVPTTLNVSGLDEHGWQAWAVPPEWAEKARRQMVAYQEMGCIPTWTCAPYQTEHAPRFGQPFGEVQVGRADVDRAVDVCLGDVEQRTRPEDVGHAQDDAHRQGGGRAAIAAEEGLVEVGELDGHLWNSILGKPR